MRIEIGGKSYYARRLENFTYLIRITLQRRRNRNPNPMSQEEISKIETYRKFDKNQIGEIVLRFHFLESL